VYAWQSDFNKDNITRWIKQNLLIKLRNSFYCFPEYLKTPDFRFYISNRIYRPSYISIHSALAFYGIIPEAVIQTTAVSTLKTSTFSNVSGTFTYQHILPELMFGYNVKPILNGQPILFAQAEKAILDLLYLYPFYNNEKEIIELRFDDDFMQNDLNVRLFNKYIEKFKSKALQKRAELLLKIYEL
jgi:predicted transcriptional regulator of viral defense system